MRGSLFCLWTLSGCAALDDATAPSPTPFVSATHITVANSAHARRMDDFLAPTKPPESGESTRTMERCAKGENVRHLWPARYAVVEIQSSELRFAGRAVLALNDNVLPPDASRGMLINALFDVAQQMAEDHKAMSQLACWPSFQGEVLVVADPATPMSLLRSVMYTLGQAQFAAFSFAVSDPPVLADPTASAEAPAPTLHAPQYRRCVDHVELILDGARALHATIKPNHGGVLKQASTGASAVFTPKTGAMDPSGLSDWVGQHLAGATSAGLKWVIQSDGNTTVGESLVLHAKLVSEHPATSVIIDRGGAGTAGAKNRVQGAAMPPADPTTLVAVLPMTLPAIDPPGSGCHGANGQFFPYTNSRVLESVFSTGQHGAESAGEYKSIFDFKK